MHQTYGWLLLIVVISLHHCNFGWTYLWDFKLALQFFFCNLYCEYQKHRNPQHDETNKNRKCSSSFPTVFASTDVSPIDVVWSHRFSGMGPLSSNESAVMFFFPASYYAAIMFDLCTE